MPTFSCPVLVLVQPIHSEGGEAHAELIVVATDFWRPSFSAAVTEYEVATAPQSPHRCSILTSWCPGVGLQHNCRANAGFSGCEHRGNRNLSHLSTHLDARLYSECVES